MFAQLSKLRELRRLLRERRYLEVLTLSRDGSIHDHRRAVAAREKAREGLLLDARRLKAAGDPAGAYQLVRGALAEREDPAALDLHRELCDLLGSERDRRRALDGEIAGALRRANEGHVEEALARLAPLAAVHPGAGAAMARVRESQQALTSLRGDLESALDAKNLDGARRAGIAWRERWGAAPEGKSFDGALGALAVKLGDPEGIAGVLGDVGGPSKDGGRADGIAGAAAALSRIIEKELRAGREAAVRRWLAQAGAVESDEGLGAYCRGLRHLDRARLLADAGEGPLAREALAAAAADLPGSALIRPIRSQLDERDRDGRKPLEQARRALAQGNLLLVRELLGDLVARHPKLLEAQALLTAANQQEESDRRALDHVRQCLARGGLLGEARQVLVALEARRPDLSEVPVLMRELDRRRVEVLPTVGVSEPRSAAPTSPGARGNRPVWFHDVAQFAPAPLTPATPFVLRVEEHGDWLIHPKNSLLFGSAHRAVADLPIMAALGSRHAWIDRSVVGDQVGYQIRPEPGRSVKRNRQGVTEPTRLQHGDVVELGSGVRFTFRSPVPDNGSAVLEFDGDWTVYGCRRVVLFHEAGRTGSLVIGPGPGAHVPLSARAERLELFRATDGPLAGELVARSPRGVAVGSAGERAQGRLMPGVPVSCGEIRLFLDPV